MEQNTSPGNYNFQDDDNGIDIKRYLSMYISNWYWFVIALFFTLSIAYSINRWSEKIYIVSSTLLIKDDQFGVANADLTNIFPRTESFRSQQNLENEIGILKSFNLNSKAIQQLKDSHVEYIAVGKRNIVESRMYNTSPFVVVYDSLEKQTKDQKVGIKIISDKKYKLMVNSGKGISTDKAFGENVVVPGFDFKIELRDSNTFEFDPDASNK
jgi:uncharacterized protein involved in exopolysaccharide biosynthesis